MDKKKIVEDESEIPYNDEPIDDGICLLVGFSDEEYEDIKRASHELHIDIEQFIQEAALSRLWDMLPTIGYDELETGEDSSVWLPPER